MASEPKFVTNMDRAFVSQDGSIIEMTFKADDGEVIVLRFRPGDLETFASRVGQLSQQARIQNAATSGHHEIRATMVTKAGAEAPVGGGRVILMLRSDKGLVSSFSLAPEEVTQLRPQLRKAEASAKAQAKETRQ